MLLIIADDLETWSTRVDESELTTPQLVMRTDKFEITMRNL